MVAAMLGLLATACNKDEVTPQDNMTIKTPITINASYGSGNNGSKVSYTESGNTISATWQSGDKLLVVYNNNVNTLDLATGAGTANATFTGTISGTPSEGATLVCYVKDQNTPDGTITVNGDGSYIYTSDAFLGQNGTLAEAAKLNLYCGWTRYSSISDINCALGVNTSMMKFTVGGIDEDAGKTATITYKSSGVGIAKASFIVAPGGSTLYLTIPAGQYTGLQSLVYNCNETELTYQLSSTQANFTAGQTYSKNITYVNPDIDYSSDLTTPLTFEAKTAGATVSLGDGNKYLNIEYSLNGSAWSTYTRGSTITLYNIGEKVSFRGNNTGTCNSNDYSGNKFTCTGECYIYGNMMSLLSSSDYATTTTLTSYNAFFMLFKENSSIYNHPTKKIMLPATTLTYNCYYGMFYHCTNLTASPALPATTLAPGCYCNMFEGCTSLTAAPALYATILAHDCYHNMFKDCSALPSAPALPATTMAEFCYQGMFQGCSSLTIAPTLPATTLANYCYSSMFSGCTSLTTAPALPVTSLANDCYEYMFSGCTSLTTAPSLPATTMADYCYQGMFSGCTSLTTAPTLPATTLASNCYSYMFKGCTGLTTIPTLPAKTLSSSCYSYMFQNCTNLTTVPDLPAKTLTSSCYYAMFYGCTNLNYVKCLATSIDGTLYWLQDVSPTGTFVKASSASWGRGVHGIPSGWTIENQ